MPTHRSSKPLMVLTLMALASAGTLLAGPAGTGPWARITEDDDTIKIETGQLEAVIPKKNPKQWMTGIAKGSFLDKGTGFREAGDGLCIVDWIMEPGRSKAPRPFGICTTTTTTVSGPSASSKGPSSATG